VKHSECTSRRTQCGFTLIDLLAVVAAVSVMLLEAAPSLGAFVNAVRLTRLSDHVVSQVDFARTEAARRNTPVVLCKSSDGFSCAGSGGWEQGWIVFHDTNRNGSLDPGEQVIARQKALPAAVRLTGNPHGNYVSFAPRGTMLVAGIGADAATLTLCRQWNAGGEARQIILDATGGTRVRTLEIASCA
jgi:type IV fimbrial biogenesis protein FimT